MNFSLSMLGIASHVIRRSIKVTSEDSCKANPKNKFLCGLARIERNANRGRRSVCLWARNSQFSPSELNKLSVPSPNTHASYFSSLLCLFPQAVVAFSFILYVEHARSKVQVKRGLREVFFVRFFASLFDQPDTVTIA